MAIVLHGRAVTMDAELGIIDDATIYISDPDAAGNATIEAVSDKKSLPPSGYRSARHVRTKGSVYPGLVDLHNHLAYNYRSLWVAPRDEPYVTRDQWPRATTYSREISKPTAALGTAAAKAVLKFAEVKAIVGGTTSIQGSPGMTRPYEGWLVRNIEHETFGTGKDAIYQSVLNLDREQLKKYSQHMDNGASFIYHLAEGTSPKLVSEFEDVKAAGCLKRSLIGIHSTALGAQQFREWGKAGGAVVWSPFSNLWLYRDTTDVVSAHNEGLHICLGADWGPSGSKNVLGELKVAHLHNERSLKRAFTNQELCAMATSNAGDALEPVWGPRIGRVKPGTLADLVVVASRKEDPYLNLIYAGERHVKLVLVGGRPAYGNRTLMQAAGAEGAETIRVAGVNRAITLVNPKVKDADMSWGEVVSSLERVRKEPVAAVERALTITSRGEQTLRLLPDMPGGDLAAEMSSVRDLGHIQIPPLDSIYHDAAFFRSLAPDRAPILAGKLEGLQDYFR